MKCQELSSGDDVVLSAELVGSFEWTDVVTKKTEDQSRSDNVIWDIFMITKWIRNPTRSVRQQEYEFFLGVMIVIYSITFTGFEKLRAGDWTSVNYKLWTIYQSLAQERKMLCYAVPSAEYISCN